MLKMQTTEPAAWTFLDEGNVVVSKHGANDSNHIIEQEHSTMKVKGGLIGIIGNEQAMKKCFIIAPSIGRLVHEFRSTAMLLHHFIMTLDVKNERSW